MNNDDFFAPPPARPPSPPAGYPVGASDQFHGYAPHERQALAEAALRTRRSTWTGRAPRMSFVERLLRGLTLARTSGRVVAQVPSLLVAPLVALVVAVAAVVGYAYALGDLSALDDDSNSVLTLKLAPLVAILAVTSVLAQAVIVDGSTERMQLGTPSLGRSWGKALSHLPDLVAFAVLCAVLNTLTGLLRHNRITAFVAALVDDAWEFATYFAVPVVLYENAGPLTAVKRSAKLARTYWAEQLVARGALGLAVFVLSLPLLAVALLAGLTFGTVGMVLLVVVVLLFVQVVSATLAGVLSAAIYRLAVTGEVAPGFTRTDMDLLFR